MARRALVLRGGAGFALGYLLLHPVAMLVVGVSPPDSTLSLRPVWMAFSIAHLPMGIVFALLGAGAGLAHHWRVAAQVAASRAESVAAHERARLESLVQLAGAVCHELGQPITAVLIYSRMMAAKLPPGDPLSRHLMSIEEGAGKVADLLRKLQDLTRFETKPYFGDQLIVDLERSAEAERRTSTNGDTGPTGLPG